MTKDKGRNGKISMKVYLYDADGTDKTLEFSEDLCQKVGDKQLLWIDRANALKFLIAGLFSKPSKITDVKKLSGSKVKFLCQNFVEKQGNFGIFQPLNPCRYSKTLCFQ